MQSQSRTASLGRALATPRNAFGLLMFLGFLLFGLPADAALPTIDVPEGIDGGACGDGDWLCAMGGYFKQGITIFGLVLAGLGFIYVVMGGLGKWRAYSMGRAELADLKEYMILAAVFAIFLIVMITYAFEVFEG